MESTMDQLFFGFLGGFTFIALLFPMLLLSLAIPYGIIYLRNQQGMGRDPQIGIKVGLYFFFSLSILLALNGLTIFVVDALVDSSARGVFDPDWPGGGFPSGRSSGLSAAQRTAGAFIMAGILFTAIHLILIKTATNDHDWPATRRVFVGWRFAIHGLVVISAFTALLAVLFQKNMGDKDARLTLVGILIIWTPSWLLHFLLLWIYCNQSARAPRALPVANPFALSAGDAELAPPPMARLDGSSREQP